MMSLVSMFQMLSHFLRVILVFRSRLGDVVLDKFSLHVICN